MRESYCILKVIGYWLLVIVFLLSPLTSYLSPLHAQPRLRTPEYYLGVHGGVTASSVNFSPKVDNMSPITKACVLGGNGGLVFRYAGHKYCHFQMELNYQHRGWATGNDTVARNARNLHYMELPILMHLNFGSEQCRWIFNLGPKIGYCIKDESYSITHKFDWGLAVGTGFYVDTKKAGVYELEVRFNYSFGGVFGTNLTDQFNIASPMDLSLNLGYYFPIRKKQHRYENKL